MNSNWGPAAVIVFGYLIAAFWQNKRFEDLKLWLDSEFRSAGERSRAVEERTTVELKALNTLIDERFKTVNTKLDSIDGRVKALEDARASGVIGVR